MFWYDDGPAHWQPAARRAWAGAPVSAALEPAGVLDADVSAAAGRRAGACRDLLAKLGIWPDGQADPAAYLRTQPGLAEEVLAVVARLEADEGLAELLYERAWRRGGRLEAATTVARLRGAGFVDGVARLARGLDDFGDRAAQILCDLDTPRAWGALADLVADGRAGWMWLPVAAARTKQPAGVLMEALLGRTQVHLGPHVLAWTGLAMREPTPDALALQAMRGCAEYPGEARILALLLPPFRRPAPALAGNLLETMYDEGRACHAGGEAAVLLATKNPCAAATRFLRRHAEEDPLALLGLAIRAGKRFSDLIGKAAAARPGELAAVLALIASQGVAAVLTDPGRRPGGADFVRKARALYVACEALDLAGVAAGAAELEGHDVRCCQVLVAARPWGKSPGGRGPAALAASTVSEAAAGWLRKAGIDGCVVAGALADVLRTGCGEALRDWSWAMELFEQPWGQFELCLDLLSGHRLLAGLPREPGSAALEVDAAGTSDLASLLFFDDSGRRRGAARLAWRHMYLEDLPSDPFEAARMAELVAEKWELDEADEGFRSMTEIHKRLLRRAIAARR